MRRSDERRRKRYGYEDGGADRQAVDLLEAAPAAERQRVEAVLARELSQREEDARGAVQVLGTDDARVEGPLAAQGPHVGGHLALRDCLGSLDDLLHGEAGLEERAELPLEHALVEVHVLEAIGETIKDKKIVIGVIDHHTLQVERPDQVADLIREALKYIPPDRLVISSDCGMGREGMSRRHATYKMVAMVLGTNIVRKELGLPEAECLAADPRFSLLKTR